MITDILHNLNRDDATETEAFNLLDEYLTLYAREREQKEVLKNDRKTLRAHRDKFVSELAAEKEGAATRLGFLAARCGMDVLKLLIFLLALAPERDVSYLEDYSNLGIDVKKRATMGFAKALAGLTGDSDRTALAAVLNREVSAPFWCMFRMEKGYEYPSMDAPLFLKTRTISFLYGFGVPRARNTPQTWGIGSYATLAVGNAEEVVIYQKEYEALLRGYTRMLEEDKTGGIILLTGPVHSGRHFLMKRLAGELRKPVLFIHADNLLTEGRADALEDDIMLERLISAQLLVFDRLEETGKDGKNHAAEQLIKRISRMEGYFFIIAGEKPPADCLAAATYVEIPLHTPTPAEKNRLWSFFGEGRDFAEDVELSNFGSQYVLHPAEIPGTIETASYVSHLAGKDKIDREDLAEAVRQHDRHSLGHMATRISCVFDWDDLIVEPKVMSQLKIICNQVKYRSVVADEWGFYKKTPYGRGIYALFFGSPGTGKTMAVQVIAKDLGLDLYRIDISALVSKYIGETEKNITELFDRAKEVNALLFFDEADALFAKRSEGSDANDRSANAQTAHLLQKMEEYEGIAILATNLKANIDPAFARRIKFMVHFDKPDVETRKLLWRKAFPPDAPLSDNVSLDRVAQSEELAGSAIKDVAYYAAHLAAAEGSEITNRHISEAVKANAEKEGRIFSTTFL